MKRSVPPKKVILTKSLRSHFGDQSFETLNTQLKEFAHADHLGRGNLDIEQFRTALGLPDSKYVTELFNMLDVTESGTIDFREYIAGRALISQHLSTEESLKMVFSAFDVNNVGSYFFARSCIGYSLHNTGWCHRSRRTPWGHEDCLP